MPAAHRLLVFGATGAIGSAIVQAAAERGWEVTGVSRGGLTQTLPGVTSVAFDPLVQSIEESPLMGTGNFDAVCWAQGANGNDSVYDVAIDAHMEMYRANCVYILAALQGLLKFGKLSPASRLCIISSVWQKIARQSKLSYCMTKAALQGLVLSASADLAADGHLINAVLPGALETPMTRRNLSPEQLQRLTSATKFERLATLEDVTNTTLYLCSPENTGLTGQFVAVDLGFSNVRIV